MLPDLGYSPPRLKPVLELAETCQYDSAHAHQVTRLAIRLFHELGEIHFLPDNSLELLTYAGILHDIGWLYGWRGHHKSSQEIILRTPLLPFTGYERMVIGNIARYHRGALPKPGHEFYTTLPSEARHLIDVLGGMLRLADGMDASHQSVVIDLLASTRPNRSTLLVNCRAHPAQEIIAADQKKDLLEKALTTKIIINWERMPPTTNYS